MAIHGRDAVTVSAAVATRSCAYCNSMEGHTSLNTALVTLSSYTISIFLDLSKTFDTLDHSILLQKLNHYGIDGKAIQLCESYLTNRTQCVEINGVKSGALPITTGVPHGSIIGPLFVIIYINDFSFASKAFTFISYADDTTLFSTVSNFTNTPNTDANCLINQELFKINEWLEINKLSLNIAKTKYICCSICTTKKSIHLLPKLSIHS